MFKVVNSVGECTSDFCINTSEKIFMFLCSQKNFTQIQFYLMFVPFEFAAAVVKDLFARIYLI